MSGGRPRVVLALSPRAEQRIESLIFDVDAPLELLASSFEADELLRTASEREPEAVLISPGLSGLTRAHCERLRAAGINLVGLAVDERDREALERLAIETSLTVPVSREQLLAGIQQQAAATPRRSSAGEAAPRERGGDRGSLVAVIGGKGAPGSSECAASLAALASERYQTLLVELDALGGSLALRLDADPGHGSILGVIRASQSGEDALGELIERWQVEQPGWPAALLGASDPLALRGVAQPGAITSALDALAVTRPLVFCDVGFLLSDPQQPATRVHREALIAADAVLLVLGASETQLRGGLRQLDLILGELAVPAERLRVLLCGLGGPSSASKEQVKATLAARLGQRGVALDASLPWDTRGARRAARRGTPLALAHRHGAYTRALRRLLDELFLPDTAGSIAPRTRRHKRRLSLPAAGGRQTPASREQDENEAVALPWQS